MHHHERREAMSITLYILGSDLTVTTEAPSTEGKLVIDMPVPNGVPATVVASLWSVMITSLQDMGGAASNFIVRATLGAGS
jgi:hypothetical protein